jgi:hypothetical protein
MAIFIGLLTLFLLCSFIILLASIITSQYEIKKSNFTEDPFSYLFDVYGK